MHDVIAKREKVPRRHGHEGVDAVQRDNGQALKCFDYLRQVGIYPQDMFFFLIIILTGLLVTFVPRRRDHRATEAV